MRAVVFRRGRGCLGSRLRGRGLLLSRKKRNQQVHARHGNPAPERGVVTRLVPGGEREGGDDQREEGGSPDKKREALELQLTAQEVGWEGGRDLVQAVESRFPLHEVGDDGGRETLQSELGLGDEEEGGEEERAEADGEGAGRKEENAGAEEQRDKCNGGEDVWVLTKTGPGRAAVPCVVKGRSFETRGKEGKGPRVWVCYDLGKELWEEVGAARWRLKSRKERDEETPVIWGDEFSVKRLLPLLT